MREDKGLINKTMRFWLPLVLVLFMNLVPQSASAINFGDILTEATKVINVLDKGINGQPASEVQSAGESSALFGGIFTKWESSWELSAGKEGHEALLKKPGLYRDSKMINQVGRIAKKLVPTLERQDLTYHFAVLDTDEVNAFALPGGYVYVTKGLMKQISNDDELAGVIAHELGHVNKKHSVKQAEKTGIMTAVVALMGLKDETRKYAAAAAVAEYFAAMKFSRDDEYEADKCAVDYTAKAGFNPSGIINFFDKINKDSGMTKVTKYFSTHPPTTDRIAKVKAEIARIKGNSAYTPVATTPAPTPKPQVQPQQPQTQPQVTGKPTQAQLQAAYEAYCFTKAQYEYQVSKGAPVEDVMKALKAYQAAKERYFALNAAMNR